MPAVLTPRYDDVDDDIHMYMYIFVCMYVRVCVNTYACIFLSERVRMGENDAFPWQLYPSYQISLSLSPSFPFLSSSPFTTPFFSESHLSAALVPLARSHMFSFRLSLSLSVSLSLFLFLLVLTHPLTVFPSRKKTIHCQYSRPRHPPTVKPTFSSFLFFNGATNTEGIRSLPFFFPSRPPIMTLRSMIFYHTSWRELSGESGAS